jgi:hypothetical protein
MNQEYLENPKQQIEREFKMHEYSFRKKCEKYVRNYDYDTMMRDIVKNDQHNIVRIRSNDFVSRFIGFFGVFPYDNVISSQKRCEILREEFLKSCNNEILRFECRKHVWFVEDDRESVEYVLNVTQKIM